MDQDHVSPSELLPAGHLLPDKLAVVNDELDVEVLHAAAGLALAAVGLLDVAEPLAEGEIRLLDRILQERPVDLVGERVNEGRVAFELGEAEGRTQRPHQRIHDVGDDVLGVVEFDPGHEVRVTGNVGDHETCRFRAWKHREASLAPAGRGGRYPACRWAARESYHLACEMSNGPPSLVSGQGAARGPKSNTWYPSCDVAKGGKRTFLFSGGDGTT